MSSVDVRRAREALTDHRFYKYRGCAPDADDPTRAAGNPGLSVEAWGPVTEDGGEPAKARVVRLRAVKAVCGVCPVLAECRAWANQVGDDGKLAEREDVVAGGMTALERSRLLIRSRGSLPAAAPGHGDTLQKRAVLVALAGSADADVVARAAGLDTRTANWHRSKLCQHLGLDRESATREDLLRAARRHGLLPVGVRVARDVVPVAAAPTSDGVRQRRIRRQHAVQLALLEIELDETTENDELCSDDLMERAA